MIREESGLFDGALVDMINLGYAHRDHLLQVLGCNGNAQRIESKPTPAPHKKNKADQSSNASPKSSPEYPYHRRGNSDCSSHSALGESGDLLRLRQLSTDLRHNYRADI